MQEQLDRIAFLLTKLMNKEELTREEKTELDLWVAQSPHNQLLWDDIINEKGLPEAAKNFMEFDDESGRQKIAQKMSGQKKHRKLVSIAGQYRWLYAAAAFVVLVSATSYFWNSFQSAAKKNNHTSKNAEILVRDVTPGSDKAVLTLADGSTILLDSARNGLLAHQGNTKILQSGGRLDYNDSAKAAGTGEIQYNTLSTPRGGQYQIILPDGSKVWLNAASSLRFPVNFAANERRVELTGEAYFEIAKVSSRERTQGPLPFRVFVNDIQVEVSGTRFNVMAYQEEKAINTTLLEGSVKVIRAAESVLLKPEQQATLSKSGELKVVQVDIQQAVAWKNGIFHLTGADIGTIMRQVSRWYDVEVEYTGLIPAGLISGEIPRTMNLSEILKVLDLSGVKSKLEGRKVIILP